MIYCIDNLEFMRELPDDSFDMVITSPPYEDARTYGIDFKIKGQDWVDWAFERFVECVRVSKGLVAWVVEGKTRKFRYSASPVLLMADLHRAGVHLRKPPIFHRVGIPGSGGPDWLRNDYEFVVCATSGGRLPWSENTAMGHPPKWAPGGEMSHRLSDGTKRNQWGGGQKSTGGERGKDGKLKQNKGRPSHLFKSKRDLEPKVADAIANGLNGQKLHTKNDGEDMRLQCYTPPKKANPGNVIHCKVGGGQMGDSLAHENEAPFPESLVEFFIRSFCPPDGVVFDPFIGSGTTAAVAKKHGRRYAGCDIRQSQVDLTNKRLEQILSSEVQQ